MEQNQQPIFENSGLDETAKAYLLETAKWTKFLAVIMMVFMGLGFIGMTIGLLSGNLTSEYNSEFIGGGFILFFYLLCIGLYIYPVLALYNFSTSIKSGIETNNRELVNEGLRHQKSMFKYLGIVMIIVLVLYGLIFLFGILAAMLGR
jgi:hypothetical protein